MNKKGFVKIATIIGVVIIAGIAGYFVLKQQQPSFMLIARPTPTPMLTPTGSPSSKLHPRFGEFIKQGSPNSPIEIVINLRETASQANVIKDLQPYDMVVLERYRLINGFLARIPLKNIESVAAHPDVLYISPRFSGEPPPN